MQTDSSSTVTDSITTGKQYLIGKYRKFTSYSSLLNLFIVITTLSSILLYTLALILTNSSFVFTIAQKSPFVAYLTMLTTTSYFGKILPIRLVTNYFVSSTPLYNWVNLMALIIFVMFLRMRRMNIHIFAIITATSSTVSSLLSYWKIRVFPNFIEGLCYSLIGYAILELILNIVFFYFSVNKTMQETGTELVQTDTRPVYTLNQGLLNPDEQRSNNTNTISSADTQNTTEEFENYLERNDFKMDKIPSTYFKFILVFMAMYTFYRDASEHLYFKRVSLAVSLFFLTMYKMIIHEDGKKLKVYAFKVWAFVLMIAILSISMALTLKGTN